MARKRPKNCLENGRWPFIGVKSGTIARSVTASKRLPSSDFYSISNLASTVEQRSLSSSCQSENQAEPLHRIVQVRPPLLPVEPGAKPSKRHTGLVKLPNLPGQRGSLFFSKKLDLADRSAVAREKLQLWAGWVGLNAFESFYTSSRTQANRTKLLYGNHLSTDRSAHTRPFAPIRPG